MTNESNVHWILAKYLTEAAVGIRSLEKTGCCNFIRHILILWPPDAKSWLTGKELDDWKDWRQEEKETTEDETVGQHHQHNVHEFEQTPGNSEGQESLACCSPWCCKELDMTEWLTEQQQRSNDSIDTLIIKDHNLKISQFWMVKNSHRV